MYERLILIEHKLCTTNKIEYVQIVSVFCGVEFEKFDSTNKKLICAPHQ